ncbi:MAG TPA: hypothetical protein VII38_13985 [Polyangia bacterium]
MGADGTLVVAAYEPELAGLRQRLAAPIAEGRIGLRAIGIGLVDAAAGAERALYERSPARVILIGTAGALPGALAVGAVVVARAARLVVRPVEYAPGPMAQRAEADRGLAEALAAHLEAPLVEVASPVGITSDDDEAARLAQTCAVEQLECFALLRAAERAKVPATAVLAIANRVGKNAAAEWRAHRVAAEAAAQDALSRALAAIGY